MVTHLTGPRAALVAPGRVRYARPMHARALLVAVTATALACGGSGGAGPDGGPDDGDAGVDGAVTPAGQAVFAPDVLHAIELTVDAQHLATLDDDSATVRVPATISFDGAVIAALAATASGGSGLAVLGVAAAIAVVLGLALEMGEGELAADSLAVAAAAVELAVAVGFAAVAPAVRSPFVG